MRSWILCRFCSWILEAIVMKIAVAKGMDAAEASVGNVVEAMCG